jgi:uncharacterized membrane protein YhhN
MSPPLVDNSSRYRQKMVKQTIAADCAKNGQGWLGWRSALICGYGVLSCCELLLVAFGADGPRWATKPLLAPVLALWLWTDNRRTRPATPFLAGLAFATGGDVALLLPGKTWLMVGIGLFLGMQLCYLVGFLRIGRPGRVAIPGYGIVWLLFAVVAAPKMGAVMIPGLVYSATLVAMAAAATGVGRLSGIGAGIFVFSDLMISLGVVGWSFHGLPVVIMATYILAQGLIVWQVRMALRVNAYWSYVLGDGGSGQGR